MGVHAMWISAIHNYGNILNLANFNIARDTYSKLVDKLINVPSIDINSIADELAVLDNFYNDIILHMSEADKRVFEYVNTDSLRTELHNIINNEDIWILPDDMDRIKDGIIDIRRLWRNRERNRNNYQSSRWKAICLGLQSMELRE